MSDVRTDAVILLDSQGHVEGILTDHDITRQARPPPSSCVLSHHWKMTWCAVHGRIRTASSFSACVFILRRRQLISRACHIEILTYLMASQDVSDMNPALHFSSAQKGILCCTRRFDTWRGMASNPASTLRQVAVPRIQHRRMIPSIPLCYLCYSEVVVFVIRWPKSGGRVTGVLSVNSRLVCLGIPSKKYSQDGRWGSRCYTPVKHEPTVSQRVSNTRDRGFY